MTETKQPEQIVEEITEDISKVISEEVQGADDSPATEIEKPEINYLNPQLFDSVRVISKRELDESVVNTDIPQEIKEKYFNTISDISENQVITGRIIGLNDKEVLVDIGFKSEGIINRNEFGKEIPKIGEKMEVFLEYIEDRSGKTVLSKEKADFMRRW